MGSWPTGWGLLVPAVAVFVVTCGTIAIMLRFSHKMSHSVPEERSMHLLPIPSTGGLGISAGILPVALFLDLRALPPVLLLALVLSLFSALDDRRPMPALCRLPVHAGVAVAFLIFYAPEYPARHESILLALLIVWAINMYNFMDGLDGLAGGMAVTGFGACALAGWWQGGHEVALVSLLPAAAALAFLCFNFHPARIFLGDGGSIPLGFLAASLGLFGWWNGLWPPLFPLLVFSPFLVDSGVTLLKRLIRREKVWLPHKSHYYQRLARMGLGHRLTTLWYYLLMAAAALSGLLLILFPGYDFVLALFWSVFYATVLFFVDRKWARHNADAGCSAQSLECGKWDNLPD